MVFSSIDQKNNEVEDYEEIWKVAHSCFDELLEQNKTDVPDCEGCNHKNTFIDSRSSEVICEDCGVIVQEADYISQEWMLYKDDTGRFTKNTQRGEIYNSDNPFDNQGSMFRHGIFSNNRSLISRLQIQMFYDHKQKTVWEVNKKFQYVAGILGHNPHISSFANKLWITCVQSNIVTRATVRSGLIAMCYYYSCVENNVIMDRDKLAEYFECDNLAKGEKVFYSIIETQVKFRHLSQKKIDIQENNSFHYFCSKLGLDFKVAMQCNDFFNQNKKKFKIVTPKSATAGIIVHIVKNELKLKYPSKSDVGKLVNVCIPTLNKVLKIIEDIN